VKTLLESVKENNDFLTQITFKYSTPGLNGLIADKSPQEVITIIKRFEYDQLNSEDKEKKNRKIRKHYSLKENAELTNDKIDDYLYKVAIGEIIESSISEPTKPQNNNVAKKIGISLLVLVVAGSFLFILFVIRKRKKRK
jgi:hypothetical protein